MTESFILLVDHEKICRLCLHSASGMSDIFEENEETSLQKLILRATGIKIESNAGLPSKICYRCRHLVELACELQDMVGKTQAILSNAGNQPAVKESEVLYDEEISNSADTSTSANDTLLNKEKQDLELPCQETIPIIVGMKSRFRFSSKHTDDDFGIPETRTSIEDNKENEKVGIFTSNGRKMFPKHLTCQICLTVFTNLSEVESHVELHYVNSKLTSYLKLQRPYRCEECNNEEMCKTQLIVHHRRHLNINPFVCKQPECSYVGKNQDSLRHHSFKHGACTKVCEVCGAAYRRNYELYQHTLRAHKAEPKQCQVCGGQFRNVLSLRQHALKCRKPHKYPCAYPDCTKAYHTRGELVAHTRTHTDERLFRCHLCDVANYTSRSMLNRHLRLHARKRTMKCDKCSATFGEYGAFYTHRVSSHGPWQPYRCNRCNRGYRTEASLEKHLEICENVTNT